MRLAVIFKIFGILLILGNVEGSAFVVEGGAFVAEATEIIGVVRIGVSLVEYIYRGKQNKNKNL